MKKNFITTVILPLIVLATFILVAKLDYSYLHYNLNAQVISIESQIVTAKDDNGELWQFTIDNNNLQVNDKIILEMFNNETTTIYDDEVVSYK